MIVQTVFTELQSIKLHCNVYSTFVAIVNNIRPASTTNKSTICEFSL